MPGSSKVQFVSQMYFASEGVDCYTYFMMKTCY